MYADVFVQLALCGGPGQDAILVIRRLLIAILLLPTLPKFEARTASATNQPKTVISVVVLPVHDMCNLAGEIVGVGI